MNEAVLTLGDFPTFFEEATGFAPFAWQRRLTERLVNTGQWPDALNAPTGAGKSAVVEIHSFAVAMSAVGGARVPRRLALVVGRRALVDSHADRAEALVRHLMSAESGTVSERVRLALARSTISGDRAPIRSIVLRGQAPRDRTWVDDPTQCLVICATPDMFGSRLLFRGYGTSRLARPRDAGLLGYDCVAVLDEGHLSRQLEMTARRIGELEAATPDDIGMEPLRVVTTTATPVSRSSYQELRVEGVQEEDLNDTTLAERLLAPKPLTMIESAHWPAKKQASKMYVTEIADQAAELAKIYGHQYPADPASARTVGCIVNNVDTAGMVAGQLTRSHPELTVVLRTGRSRPYDIDREHGIQPQASDVGSAGAPSDLLAETWTQQHFPGLFSIAGHSGVDILVTTQAIEVGVDVDLAAMVTELAPGSALAQRFGRVNRVGQRPATELRVVVPRHTDADYARPPYSTPDLNCALLWLERLRHTELQASPWAVAHDPPPEQELSRTVLQRPESWNARHWSQTSSSTFATDDLDLFLKDDLSAEQPLVGVVVRNRLPRDSSDALALLNRVPPCSSEIFPSRIADARGLAERIMRGESSEELNAQWRVFRARNDEVIQMDLSGAQGISSLATGDVLIIDDVHPILRHGVTSGEPSEKADPVPWEHLEGVTALLLGEDVDDLGPIWEAEEMAEQAAGLIPMNSADNQKLEISFIPPEDHEPPQWVLVFEAKALAADEEARQIWSPSQNKVPLDVHAGAVARLTRRMADLLGLPEHLSAALVDAAVHHDDGKSATAFQMMLEADPDQPAAKSGHRSQHARRRAAERSGLPAGWRHEQMSVVLTDASREIDDLHSLVLQLVGTTHGYGRPFFHHGSEMLLSGDTDSRLRQRIGDEGRTRTTELFDTGAWDTLIETNRRRWGSWGVAFLEAVLRAADGTASKEGS